MCLNCGCGFHSKGTGAKYCSRTCSGVAHRRVHLGGNKFCPVCSRYKDKTEFHENKTTTDGLQSRCIECRRALWIKYKSPEDRFWKNYHQKTCRVGECIEWTGAHDVHGRPVIRWDDGHGTKQTTVARVVYKLAIGPVSDDEVVLVSCNNRRCVRHSHLALGSRDDLLVKLRNNAPTGDRHRSHVNPERSARGTRHGRAKLIDSDVRDIRVLYTRGGTSFRLLSERYKVSESTIADVIHRKIWTHVE